jgi:hypothetical protein
METRNTNHVLRFMLVGARGCWLAAGAAAALGSSDEERVFFALGLYIAGVNHRHR